VHLFCSVDSSSYQDESNYTRLTSALQSSLCGLNSIKDLCRVEQDLRSQALSELKSPEFTFRRKWNTVNHPSHVSRALASEADRLRTDIGAGPGFPRENPRSLVKAQPRSQYPCGNFSDTSFFKLPASQCPRSKSQERTSPPV